MVKVIFDRKEKHNVKELISSDIKI